MSRRKTEHLQQALLEKKKKYSLRIQVSLQGMKIDGYIHGHTKDFFLDDCIKREMEESAMLNYIIDTYYSVIQSSPIISDKEPNEIKKFIIDRIKL